MAWTITNKDVAGVQGGDPQVTIICSSADDVSDLPTAGIAPGSVAIVTGSGLAVYVFGADGAWHAA